MPVEGKDEKGNGVIKPFWECPDEDIQAALRQQLGMQPTGVFQRWRFSSRFATRAEMPATMFRLNIVKLGPVYNLLKDTPSISRMRLLISCGREQIMHGLVPGLLKDLPAVGYSRALMM